MESSARMSLCTQPRNQVSPVLANNSPVSKQKGSLRPRWFFTGCGQCCPRNMDPRREPRSPGPITVLVPAPYLSFRWSFSGGSSRLDMSSKEKTSPKCDIIGGGMREKELKIWPCRVYRNTHVCQQISGGTPRS